MLGRRSQRDFEDEIRSHLELEVERLRAQGVPAEDAEHAARRHFGNVGVAEDRFYHAQRFASVQDGLDATCATRGARCSARPDSSSPASARSRSRSARWPGCSASSTRSCSSRFPSRTPSDSSCSREPRPGPICPSASASDREFYLHYKERSKLLDGVFAFSGGHVDVPHGHARRAHPDGVADQRHVLRRSAFGRSSDGSRSPKTATTSS